MGWLVSFALGVVATIGLNKLIVNRSFYFPLKFEIDLVQIVSLIATIWLAYYVSVVLDKRSNGDLNVALLVSSKIENVILDIVNFQKDIDLNRSANISLVVSFVKTLSLHKKTIKSFLDKDERFKKLNRPVTFSQTFDDSIRQLSQLTTYTPPLSTNVATPQDITIVNNVCTYSDSRIDLIGLELQKIEELLITTQYDFFTTV